MVRYVFGVLCSGNGTTAPTWQKYSGTGFNNRTLGRVTFWGKLSPTILYNVIFESEYSVQKSKINATDLLSGGIDTANMRDYNNRGLKNSGEISISLLQKKYSISLRLLATQLIRRIKNQYPIVLDFKKTDYKLIPSLSFSYKPTTTTNGSLKYSIDYASFIQNQFFKQLLYHHL